MLGWSLRGAEIALDIVSDPPRLNQRGWRSFMGIDNYWAVRLTECTTDAPEWTDYYENGQHRQFILIKGELLNEQRNFAALKVSLVAKSSGNFW